MLQEVYLRLDSQQQANRKEWRTYGVFEDEEVAAIPLTFDETTRPTSASRWLWPNCVERGSLEVSVHVGLK